MKTNKKILIVEDDNDFISILKTKFESEGFVVITAQSGAEGINKAAEEKPDLVLSDVLMSGMGGVEMARKIHAYDKSVKILFLTNLSNVDFSVQEGSSEKFDSLLKSDVRIGEIVNIVKNKLGFSGSPDGKAPPVPQKDPK